MSSHFQEKFSFFTLTYFHEQFFCTERICKHFYPFQYLPLSHPRPCSPYPHPHGPDFFLEPCVFNHLFVLDPPSASGYYFFSVTYVGVSQEGGFGNLRHGNSLGGTSKSQNFFLVKMNPTQKKRVIQIFVGCHVFDCSRFPVITTVAFTSPRIFEKVILCVPNGSPRIIQPRYFIDTAHDIYVQFFVKGKSRIFAFF